MELSSEQKTTVKIIADTVCKAMSPATGGLASSDKAKARLDYFDLLAKRQEYSAVIREAVIVELKKGD